MSPQVYRRRRIVVFSLVGVVLASLMYLSGSLFGPVPATAAVVQHEKSIVQPAAQLAWPGWGASAISAPDVDGATEYHGSDKSLPIASVTKMVGMTGMRLVTGRFGLRGLRCGIRRT